MKPSLLSLLIFQRIPPDREMPRFTITNFDQDVMTWWGAHPLNPNSANSIRNIVSPVNQLDVDADYSGVLQDAIDALPVTGGKLILGNGPYDVSSVVGKSNVHFIGNGTTVMRGISLLGGTPCLTILAWNEAIGNRTAEAMEIVANKPRNYYFKDIIFDGDNNSPYTDGYGIICRAVRDFICDDCTFQNYALYSPPSHIGAVTVHGMCDDLYFRRCHFSPPGYVGSYIDGCFGAGHIDCVFDDGFLNQRVLYMCNNDFTFDVDSSSIISENEMRNAKYIFMVNCSFSANGMQDNAMFVATGGHILVDRNTVVGAISYFARFFTYRRLQGDCQYSSIDLHVTNNTTGIVQEYFVMIDGLNQSHATGTDGIIGNLTLTGNKASNIHDDWIERLDPTVGPDTIDGNIEG